ncbi:MAG: hypothetical protein SF028_02480 [Candidatus Sumerlaeia bacterium]|nr:hypothetical protein [Candidatus Sumerlaeia bacterium]
MKLRCSAIAMLVLSATASLAGAADRIVLQTAPADTKRFEIPLRLEAAGQGRAGWPGDIPLVPVRKDSVPDPIQVLLAGKQWEVFLATQPEGTNRIFLASREAVEIPIVNRKNWGGTRLFESKLLRLGPSGDVMVLMDGYHDTNGIEVEDAVETPLGTVRVRLEFHFISGVEDIDYTVSMGTASGSALLEEGRLRLSIPVGGTTAPLPGTPVTLSFEPFMPGLPPRSAQAAITETLSLGNARFAVESIAADYSSASIAQLSGSLAEMVDSELQRGESIPAFATVDLVTRNTQTRESILAQVPGGSHCVFVFGNLPSPDPPGWSGRQPPGTLELPVQEVERQLEIFLPGAKLAIVTGVLPLEFLYADLRGVEPAFAILSDPVDPLQVEFLPRSPVSYTTPQETSGTLRQLFGLPEREVAVVVFDSAGKVVFVDATARPELVPTFAAMSEELRK